jgi:hypothetical protein
VARCCQLPQTSSGGTSHASGWRGRYAFRLSRSCHVHTQISLPSGSARIQNARALASLTSTPPASRAASILEAGLAVDADSAGRAVGVDAQRRTLLAVRSRGNHHFGEQRAGQAVTAPGSPRSYLVHADPPGRLLARHGS